ncbi:hypothetical protein D1872_265960 [compost metagenome]
MSMNSTASCQEDTPPIPEIGTLTSGVRAHSATIFSAMGFTAGPQYPPCAPFPPTWGTVFQVSRSTPARLLIVLIILTASAPPNTAWRATTVMSVILGVSFTMTGVCATSFTQYVCISTRSGCCPEAAPIPRSAMP